MRTLLLALTGLVLTSALAAPLAAQDLLETTAGTIYEGRILSDDGMAVEIQTTQGMTIKLPYEQLTPKSRYRLMRNRAGDDGRSQLELAEWCVDQKLYEEARRHYRAALAADASMADEINASVVKARKQAADELLQRAATLREEGKPKEARQVLAVIVQELPLEEAATEAARQLAEETKGRREASLDHDDNLANNESGRPARRNGQPWSEEAVKTMTPAIQAYQKLLDGTQAGLQASKQGTSIREYEKALSEGEKARKAVDKVREQAKADEELTEALALADTKLEEAIVDCRIFLVDAYLLRTSYKQAADVVKAGLAAYPQNQRLQRASERVTAAANNNDGGGWVIAVPAGRPR